MKHLFSLKLFIASVLLLSTLFVSAQKDKKSRVSIAIGPAIPMGDIKNNHLDSSILMNGFAKTGFHFNVAYTYNFANNFGITAAFFGNVNPVNMDQYRSEYQRYVKDNYPIFDNDDITFTNDNDKGSWTTGGLLIGPNINFYLVRHFYLEIRGLIGLGLGYSPEVHNTLMFQDLTYSYQQQSAHTESFAWNVGAGFNYRFDRLFIRLNVDYLSNNLKFTNLNIKYPVFDTEQTTENIPTQMEIINQQLQISAGVGICF
ncbi:MAG: outer membrane beta-barrel protein [Bacteroidales bacterium]|nr:outer membrane beta-barrel protein [Bacteroidales bacterium]